MGIASTALTLYRRTSSGFAEVATGTLPDETKVTGIYKLQVTMEGNRILVFCPEGMPSAESTVCTPLGRPKSLADRQGWVQACIEYGRGMG